MSNIRDVAREAGVSTATVSRTFTTPNPKNTQTQRRVLEAARRLGYRPRQESARKHFSPLLGLELRNTIGFQFFADGPGDSLSSNAFYGPILQGAEKEASALGLHLLLNTTDKHAFSLDMPNMVKDRVIGGMLLVGESDPAILTAIARYVPHVVLVDNHDESRTFASIVSDGFDGAYKATQYLLDSGHRENIVFLRVEKTSKTLRDRLRGFICALFENQVSIGSHHVVELPDNDPDCVLRRARIAELLQSSQRPTAILCANDYFAHKVLQVCWDLGLKVPDDLSVIGFDDIEFSRHSCPPLTTVRVDKELMGRLAVRRLYARLQKESEETEVDCLPTTLIVRGSSRPL